MTAEFTPYKTPEETAPLVGWSARTLRDKAAAGQIQHSRAGKTIWFTDDDIAAIRAAQTVKPRTPTLRVVSKRKAA